MSLPRIICLAGPTGTGKTEASLFLAERLGGAVVNFDSRQVYRGLAAVTAQPSPEEQSRHPHYLYGFLAPDRELSAGIFAKKTGAVIRHVLRQGLVPILVGGTGFYLRAILGGLDDIPQVPQETRTRAQGLWEKEGPVAMRARLSQVDPVYAAKIHPNDKQRSIRALEIFLATGRPLSSWHAAESKPSPYEALLIGLRLDPKDLALRLAGRIEAMLVAGALEEVRRTMAAYPLGARALTGIGCVELSGYLREEMDLESAKALWLKNTRAYAKRQVTWFKRQEGFGWFRPDETEAMAEAAASFLTR